MTDPSSASPAPSQRRTTRHPLLGGFPIAVMTLATFFVIFTLMMARLNAGADPALRAGANPVALTARAGGEAVKTRVSGAAAASPVVQPAAAQGAPTTAPAIVTRTSGARIGDD